MISTWVHLQRGKRKIPIDDSPRCDAILITGLAKAFYWQSLLDQGLMATGSHIAKAEGLHHSVVNELLRLTLLAPDIIEQCMTGKQAPALSLMWFQRHRLQVNWQEQRRLMESLRT